MIGNPKRAPQHRSPDCPDCDESLVVPMRTLHRGKGVRDALCQFCGHEWTVENDETLALLWFGCGAYEQREWGEEDTDA